MKFTYLITLLIFLSCKSLFASSISFQNSDLGKSVQGSPPFGGTAYFLNVHDQGTGSTKSTALVVYLPIDERVGSTNDNYLTKGDNFRFSAQQGNANATNSTLSVYLTISNDDTTNNHIYAFVEKDDENDLVAFQSNGTGSSGDTTFTFNMGALCDQRITECGNVDGTASRKEDFDLYIAVAPSTTAIGTDGHKPSDFPNGVHIKLKTSNLVQSSSIILGNLFKGDGRLFAIYDGFSYDNLKTTKAIVKNAGTGLNDATCEAAQPAGGKVGAVLGAGSLYDFETAAVDSDEAIKNLDNGTCYTVHVFHEDEFGFATNVSNGLSAIPETIDALLKKQACYLFTAGFEGEHYVVNFFREFRDSFLMKFSGGRAFIQLYYETAPKYALTIYQTPWLKTSIRTFAWILYAVMRFWYAFIGLMAVGVLVCWRFNRPRITVFQQE